VPTRGEQHPVDIHYESGVQPPEVEVIQLTLSSSSDNWTAGTASNPDHRNYREGYSRRQNETSIQVGSGGLNASSEHGRGRTRC